MSTYFIGSNQMITIEGRPGKDGVITADITRSAVDNHGSKVLASRSPVRQLRCFVDAENPLAVSGYENTYAQEQGNFVSVTINGINEGTYEVLEWVVVRGNKADPANGGLYDYPYLVESLVTLRRRGA